MQSEWILLGASISLIQDGDLVLFISTIPMIFYFKVNSAIQRIHNISSMPLKNTWQFKMNKNFFKSVILMGIPLSSYRTKLPGLCKVFHYSGK